MRPSEVAQIVGRLRAAFPSARTEDATAIVWAEALAPLDLDVSLMAARAWINEEEWFPTVAQFLDACRREAKRLEQRGTQGPAPTCRACGGLRWIEEERGYGHTDELITTRWADERWLPCNICNRVTYDRWAEGHYERDHHCQECDDIRKGRRSKELAR